MIRILFNSMLLYFFSIIMIIIYLATIHLFTHSFFKDKAQGSLIIDNTKNIRGSYLLAQDLSKNIYFKPRLMQKHNATCDLALYNLNYKNKLQNLYKNTNHLYDLSSITPSASLLDPYITKRNALKQAYYIAKQHNIDISLLFLMIEKHSLNKIYPFFEVDIVNINILNSNLILK